MNTAALKSHSIIKSLKEAGFDEKQAETIVEAISNMQDSHLASKGDLNNLEAAMAGELKQINQSVSKLDGSIGRLETSMEWIKKLLITIGIAVVIAAVKYVFSL